MASKNTKKPIIKNPMDNWYKVEYWVKPTKNELSNVFLNPSFPFVAVLPNGELIINGKIDKLYIFNDKNEQIFNMNPGVIKNDK